MFSCVTVCAVLVPLSFGTISSLYVIQQILGDYRKFPYQ